MTMPSEIHLKKLIKNRLLNVIDNQMGELNSDNCSELFDNSSLVAVPLTNEELAQEISNLRGKVESGILSYVTIGTIGSVLLHFAVLRIGDVPLQCMWDKKNLREFSKVSACM